MEGSPMTVPTLASLLEDDADTLNRVEVELSSALVPYARLVHEQFFESKKEDLTRWWLQLIETSVDSFLQTLGYDFDAVPFHYIDQPPRSMPAILKNLQMVRFLLKSSSNNLEPASLPMRRHLQEGLVEPLKREIYSRIDEYAGSVLLFLWHQCSLLLGIHLSDSTRGFAAVKLSQQQGLPTDSKSRMPVAELADAKRILEENRTIPEARRKLLLSLIGDIHYINEMKRLERDFFLPDPNVSSTPSESPLPQKKSAPSDIVPVTGLIVGKLHRLENELKTVVEHWSRRGLH